MVFPDCASVHVTHPLICTCTRAFISELPSTIRDLCLRTWGEVFQCDSCLILVLLITTVMFAIMFVPDLDLMESLKSKYCGLGMFWGAMWTTFLEYHVRTIQCCFGGISPQNRRSKLDKSLKTVMQGPQW